MIPSYTQYRSIERETMYHHPSRPSEDDEQDSAVVVVVVVPYQLSFVSLTIHFGIKKK